VAKPFSSWFASFGLAITDSVQDAGVLLAVALGEVGVGLLLQIIDALELQGTTAGILG
jgi:hypothetical protein